MDYIWYGSPNVEAMEEYPAYYEEAYEEELDQETLDIILTPPEILDKCQMYVNQPQDTLRYYSELWTELGI